MRLGVGISQEQTQKLMMTPELRLAIQILQFSAVELVEYIEQQLLENPVLEVAEETQDGEPENSEPEKRDKESDKFDIEWENYFDDSSYIRQESAVNREQESLRFDNFIAEVPTLQDHLMLQLSLARLSHQEISIGEFLIGNIDDNGYLQCTIDEATEQCKVSYDAAERLLKTIQGFEPFGVGARDLRECLLIQYEQLNLNDELLKQVISNYLQEVAEGKIMKAAKQLGVSLQQMQQAIDELKLMEPKPGRKFSPSSTRYIVPDVAVEKVDDEYVVLVNDVSSPRLTVNRVYRDMLKESKSDRESREYVESRLNSAVWLMRSIEQRRLTLYKVTKCVVDFQRDFLDRGIKFLKPMNLRHVADSVGVHESTVSRATANKYIQTPRGVFEMKFFFSGGVSNSQGTYTSAEAVKKIIQEMVEGEDPKKPLSDQKLAELLQEKGVEISRRTVAKYRDEIGIPATSRRRRY